MDKTLDELKHEVKAQKSLKKAEKKEKKHSAKARKKDHKKEKKAQKMAKKAGMEYIPPENVEVTVQPAAAGEMGIEWSRRSTVSIVKVERQLDSLFESRGEEIKKRWKEKYGDEPDIPEEMFRPKVDLENLDRTPTSDMPTGEYVSVQTSAEGQPKGKMGKLTGKFGRKKGTAPAPTMTETPSEGPLPLLALKKPPEGLWLYQKYGVGKKKIVALIVKLISGVLWLVMFIPRFVVLILSKLFGGLKRKKSRKAKAPSEAEI
ncbi:MAG: hypothetical protein KAT70_05090 [Thermoplasmata archaeon]|nr:hypothetical protein [Thermoplasmata archaeon]